MYVVVMGCGRVGSALAASLERLGHEVATVNLGRHAGLTVASALLVDYTLTVAVSMSSAAANIGALIPFVAEHKVLFCVGAIALLTAVNLRGIRESGAAFAVPVYA
ncbi:MAG: hypothetical protein QOK35_2895, partial [Pseudonocardiales bacterium]|nr:hypothetical protein [Pseudonocardiales bacterium]